MSTFLGYDEIIESFYRPRNVSKVKNGHFGDTWGVSNNVRENSRLKP